MPSRNFQEYMIVTTDKGEVRIDKDGNMSPIPDELTDDQLEHVRGGMSPPTFNMYRVKMINDSARVQKS